MIPRSGGQLGLTITEVLDFSFAFQDPAFLGALARRGIRTAEQLQKVFVTPLTPGSFGLPEEARRIVKAQMYYTEGAGINLFARPINHKLCVNENIAFGMPLRILWHSNQTANFRKQLLDYAKPDQPLKTH